MDNNPKTIYIYAPEQFGMIGGPFAVKVKESGSAVSCIGTHEEALDHAEDFKNWYGGNAVIIDTTQEVTV